MALSQGSDGTVNWLFQHRRVNDEVWRRKLCCNVYKLLFRARYPKIISRIISDEEKKQHKLWKLIIHLNDVIGLIFYFIMECTPLCQKSSQATDVSIITIHWALEHIQ